MGVTAIARSVLAGRPAYKCGVPRFTNRSGDGPWGDERGTVYCRMAWAEDGATVGTGPSVDPGAKAEGLAAGRSPTFLARRDWHPSDKPLGALATYWGGSNGTHFGICR